MSMFDSEHEGMDDEQKMKDQILDALIEKMEDVMSGRLAPSGAEHGMGVQVEAPDAEHLKEGLEKASDIVTQAGDPEHAHAGPAAGQDDEEGEKSDDERLAELMDGEGGSGDEDEEDDKDKFRK
jgi:hypothetical protein